MKGSGKPKKLPATPKSKPFKGGGGKGKPMGKPQPPTMPQMGVMPPTQGPQGDESIMGNAPGFKKGGYVKDLSKGKKKKK